MNAATRLPLEGLRVVELGRLIAAPWAAPYALRAITASQIQALALSGAI
ncbi:hypothetical protein [Ottowia sp.]